DDRTDNHQRGEPTMSTIQTTVPHPNAGAVAAADADKVYRAQVTEMRRQLDQARGNALEATRANLARLQTSHQISQPGAAQLGRVAPVLFARAHGQRDATDLRGYVQSLHQSLLNDPHATPLGRAIVAIIADALARPAWEGAVAHAAEGAAQPRALSRG